MVAGTHCIFCVCDIHLQTSHSQVHERACLEKKSSARFPVACQKIKFKDSENNKDALYIVSR